MTRSFREWAFARRSAAHSRRVYDWWGRHDLAYTVFVNAFLFGREAPFRNRTVAALALESGDRVVDIGCGMGQNFEYLADAVGPTGTVVGVDTSREMVRRSLERGGTLDTSVSVLRADATRLPIEDGQFDAVCATLSLSAIADAVDVVRDVYRVLRPGGRLVVLDTRSFRTAPGRWLNPFIEGVSAAITNWYPDADIADAIEQTFDDIAVRTYHGGTVYIAVGRKSGP